MDEANEAYEERLDAIREERRQEEAAMRRNAERYIWLRDNANRAQLGMFADRRGTRLAADRVCDAGIELSKGANNQGNRTEPEG